MPEKKEGGFECLSSPKGYLRMISSYSLSLFLGYVYVTTLILSYIPVLHPPQSGLCVCVCVCVCEREREGERLCEKEKRSNANDFFSPLFLI